LSVILIFNGIKWVNLLTEDATYELQWLEPKPVLTEISFAFSGILPYICCPYSPET
jgi:hypothetical protein